MGLEQENCTPLPADCTKYKSYKREFNDLGLEKLVTLPGGTYLPDFENRNTIQLWDITNSDNHTIMSWVGTTLIDRSLHEIKIVNGSASSKDMNFSVAYDMIDEVFAGERVITIGPGGTAHFYCTGIHKDGTLVLSMRTGSQDKRKN